jgi:hypothetical protein
MRVKAVASDDTGSPRPDAPSRWNRGRPESPWPGRRWWSWWAWPTTWSGDTRLPRSSGNSPICWRIAPGASTERVMSAPTPTHQSATEAVDPSASGASAVKSARWKGGGGGITATCLSGTSVLSCTTTGTENAEGGNLDLPGRTQSRALWCPQSLRQRSRRNLDLHRGPRTPRRRDAGRTARGTEMASAGVGAAGIGVYGPCP